MWELAGEAGWGEGQRRQLQMQSAAHHAVAGKELVAALIQQPRKARG